MEKFLIIFLVLIALLLYATTVHVQDTFSNIIIEDNIQIDF